MPSPADSTDRTNNRVAGAEDPACTRRAVLAGVAGAPLAVAGANPVSARAETGAAGSPTRSSTVATWNVSLGVNLFRLFEASSKSEAREIVGDLLAEAREHPYEARAGAIADALVAADADVVALQEASRVRTRPADGGDGDGSTNGAGDGGETVVDLLEAVRTALSARGRSYEVAASTVTTDVSLPAEGPDGRETVRLTDRDALLVRDRVETRNARGGAYDARLPIPLPWSGEVFALKRGYCLVDVGPPEYAATVGSTHLEAVSAGIREVQAEELLDALPQEGPVVVGGDFNSGPGTTTRAYDVLTGALSDAAVIRRPDGAGDTCCRPPLRSERSGLTKRVDALLSRGAARPTAVERLGEEPADRVEATVDGETVTTWPSDHAGVAGTFDVPAPPTPTPTATPTATPTPTPTATPTATETASPSPAPTASPRPAPTRTRRGSPPTSGAGPGFGVLAAVVALVVAWLGRRRS